MLLIFLYLSFIDSYVYQIPGWSGLSNARVTIFGDVYPLPEDQQVIDGLIYSYGSENVHFIFLIEVYLHIS